MVRKVAQAHPESEQHFSKLKQQLQAGLDGVVRVSEKRTVEENAELSPAFNGGRYRKEFLLTLTPEKASEIADDFTSKTVIQLEDELRGHIDSILQSAGNAGASPLVTLKEKSFDETQRTIEYHAYHLPSSSQ